MVTDYGTIEGITATLGVAEWDRECTLDHLLQLADEALYEGRRQGRDRATLVGGIPRVPSNA